MLHSVRLVYQTEAGPKLAQFQQTKQSWSSEVVVTGMLEKNVYAGVEALLAEIASQLSAEANKSVQQTTVRRRRRGTSGTGRPRTEARPQPKPSQWPSPFLVSCPSYVMICSNITQFTHCSPKAILIYIFFSNCLTASETPREKSHWLMITILVAMILLALGNMFLFVKLWRLEQQSSDHKTPLLDTPAVRLEPTFLFTIQLQLRILR